MLLALKMEKVKSKQNHGMQQPLEAEKGKEAHFPLQPTEGASILNF